MINALHLLWIIPLAAIFGFGACCVLVNSKSDDWDDLTYDEEWEEE